MNTNHALHIGSRSLILAALTALAAGCGASPDGQSTADEKSLTEPAGDGSDADSGAPSGDTTPAPSLALPTSYAPAPAPEPGRGGGEAPSGGVVPSHGAHAPVAQ